jgi:hypothetical protein
MPTRLYFAKDHTLTVEEDLSAVENAFRTVDPHPAPTVTLTKGGEQVVVNVALVRYFKGRPGRSRTVTAHAG